MSFLYPEWPAPENVSAASTTRVGGYSQGPFASFNLGAHVGDDDHAVKRNRRYLTESLDLLSQPVWLQQVHGTDIANLNQSNSVNVDIVADASISKATGKICAVMTADCLPILLTDRSGDQVAAVHAGWRSMAGEIIEKVVELFTTAPENILAWCGPCIGPSQFEVGLEVRDALGGPSTAYLPHADRSKVYANLHCLAADRLEAIGVKSIYFSDHCTYLEPELFFSYRRDGQTGRMASLIMKQS